MKFFHYDSDFMRFVTLLSRITLLNIIWSICCIPLVTIGAATAAQYYSINQLLLDDMHVFANFKKGFRLHWKKSSIIWLIVVILSAFFFMDYYILTTAVVPAQTILITISALAFLTMILSLLWVYPVMIHFTGTLKEIIFNAFVFTFMYAPVTLIACAIYVAICFLFVRYPITRGLCILFGPSLIVYSNLALFQKVFAKYKMKD